MKYRLIKNGLGKFSVEKFFWPVFSPCPEKMWIKMEDVKNEEEGLRLLDKLIKQDKEFLDKCKKEQTIFVIKEVGE